MYLPQIITAFTIRLGLALVLMAVSWTALGNQNNFTDLNQIKTTAKNFLLSQIGPVNPPNKLLVRMGHLDSRLKLRKCDGEITAYLPTGTTPLRTTTIGVRCTGTAAWSLFIPVRTQILKKVYTANQLIPRGKKITRNHLDLAYVNTAQLKRGYVTQPNEIINKIANRTISRNQPIGPNDVDKPLIITKGQIVELFIQNKSIRLRALGIALASGSLGDTIQVRNKDSRKIIEGKVVGSGKISIIL